MLDKNGAPGCALNNPRHNKKGSKGANKIFHFIDFLVNTFFKGILFCQFNLGFECAISTGTIICIIITPANS